MSEEHGSQGDAQDTAPSFGRAGKQSSSAGRVRNQNAMETLPSDEPGRVAAGEVKVVKICKSCMVSQSGGGGFCVKCGAELVPIRSVRDSCIGEVVGGKYKIVEQIGSGGMGEVYLGVNDPLGQRVAVKFLSRKFAADEGIILRFLNEARSYAKVSHPNAVTLLEYGQHEDGALYLITEFIEGKILTEVIKTAGPMMVEQLVGVAAQLCNVLSAAHKEGVIHRDLKPDNIMLIPETRGRYAVKVLDFGIAKILDDDHHQSSQMTETGSIFGTPEFMSPEQARGEPTDGRSDLYAIGIILFFMATARLPFRGKNKFAILNQQLNDAPPRPSQVRDDVEVPLDLEEIILKCLSKKADDRYQTADELAVALENMLAAARAGQRVVPAAKNVEQVHEKPRVVVRDLVAGADHTMGEIPDAMLEDRMSITISGVTGDGDDWSDSFVGTSSPHDEWEGELSEPDVVGAELEDGEWEKAWNGVGEAPVRRSSGSSTGTKAALLALVAVLLVGGAWYVTDSFRSGRVVDGSESVGLTDGEPGTAGNLDMESLGSVSRMLDAGDLEAAQRSIHTMQALVVAPEDRARLEELVKRRQSAENLEKRVRAAIQGGQCDEADRLAGTLATVSSGLRQMLNDGLKDCRRPAKSGFVDRSANNSVVPAVHKQDPVVAPPVVAVPPHVEPARPVEAPKPVEVAPVVEPIPTRHQETIEKSSPNVEKPSEHEKLEEPAVIEAIQPENNDESASETKKKKRASDDESSDEDSPAKAAPSDEALDDGMALPPRQL